MRFVVKIGGTEGAERKKILDDLSTQERNFVITHGGSAVVEEISEKVGKEQKYVESVSGVSGRYTDEETMDIIKMSMGLVRQNIVEELQKRDVDAVGLSGISGGLIKGERKDTIIIKKEGKKKVLRGDYSGKPSDVNSDLLSKLLESGYIPVVGLPMLSYEGTAVNTDADRLTSAISSEFSTDLLLLTDVEGLLKDVEDPDSLIQEVKGEKELEEALNIAEGRMKRKVMAAKEALEKGTNRVIISSANKNNPISKALGGEGTVFKD